MINLDRRTKQVILLPIKFKTCYHFTNYNFISNLNRTTSILSFLFAIIGFTACSGTSEKTSVDTRPNILILVADDLGYADLGCYGGNIATPNIDGLASSGIRFSRFHTAPMCAPTRAMLLTGNDNHIAGVGRQALSTQVFGYEGYITNRVATIPALLKKDGYHTYMAGKWHLGTGKEANPHQKGFEHSFVLLEGVGNHYNSQGLFKGIPVSHYTEDGKPTKWPEGSYSTDLYTDKLIEYIDQNKDDKRPFFAYAAYTSPHWPLQVDEAYWKKYEGRYDEGYDKLKEERLLSLKKAGMIPENAALPPTHPSVRPWNSLSENEKKREARKMELYSGMLDNLDVNIGRIVQHLKDIGEYENTLIIFMSDNGAAGEDYYNNPGIRPYINPYFNNDYETMGEANSLISYGPQWAEAGSSPFRYYKEYATNGGIIASMIITGPMVEQQNVIANDFLTVMDIAPTLYEIAKINYPSEFNGNSLFPLKGKSILPFISGKAEAIHSNDYVFGLEHSGNTMLRKGQWKITNFSDPFSLSGFELYNLDEDLGEMHDLKSTNPQKYQEMFQEWTNFASEIQVQLPGINYD
ncbi:MAG: arylsulfatase [Eudoraea sp.]|uniref:arylsulfatase n=1 Tax=Eudoraea sp. TaxID=1979955 RepID=UPI003266ECC6